MSEAKKRAYESPRRREQAEQTRARILEAAEQLLLDGGYAATSVAAIAERSDVSLRTVYLHFEGKSEVLRALWNLRLRGDMEDQPVALREWFAEALGEPDPGRQIDLNERNSRMVKQRVGGLFHVLRAAASIDPDVAELWQRIGDEFYANQLEIARSLATKKALKKGLTAERAADMLWSLNHPDYFELLHNGRGWTFEQYERRLAELLRDQLLR